MFDIQRFADPAVTPTTPYGLISQEDIDTIATFKLIVDNFDNLLSNAVVTGIQQNSTNSVNDANLTGKLVTDVAVTNHYYNNRPVLCKAGVVSTDAATAAKEVTVDGPFFLGPGARVAILMGNTSSAANPTLNVNSTGAKALYYRGYPAAANALRVNTWYDLIYDGNYWVIMTPLVFTT